MWFQPSTFRGPFGLSPTGPKQGLCKGGGVKGWCDDDEDDDEDDADDEADDEEEDDDDDDHRDADDVNKVTVRLRKETRRDQTRRNQNRGYWTIVYREGGRAAEAKIRGRDD